MASYSTLINGDKWFPYRNSNKVHPHHWQAMMMISKYHGHIYPKALPEDFGKSDIFDLEIKPYYLGEHSLRLFHSANDFLNKNKVADKEDFLLEALIFNCHKVYPPGDLYSPELTDRNLHTFNKNHVIYNRRRLKTNSKLVRLSLGLSENVNKTLIMLNKQCQANELHYLQNKNNKELELMGLPKYTKMYDFNTGETLEGVYPLNTQDLTLQWWGAFNRLNGWKRYEKC